MTCVTMSRLAPHPELHNSCRLFKVVTEDMSTHPSATWQAQIRHEGRHPWQMPRAVNVSVDRWQNRKPKHEQFLSSATARRLVQACVNHSSRLLLLGFRKSLVVPYTSPQLTTYHTAFSLADLIIFGLGFEQGLRG